MPTLIPRLMAVLAVLVALVRVADTHYVLSPTYDEPAHLATGLELLSEGRYRYEPQHPPLSRVAAATLPYLKGMRTIGHESFWAEGHHLIHDSPALTYAEVMRLARLGVLPFLVLLAFTTWLWARRMTGEWGAAIAVAVVAATPTILAHAGLAATDIAATATFPLSLFAFAALLHDPTRRRAALFGAATALALLSKLTALLFLPAAGVAILGTYLLTLGRGERLASVRAALKPTVVLAAALSFTVVLWAGYGFSVGSISDPADRPYESVDATFAEGRMRELAYALLEAEVIPAVEVLHGVRQVLGHHDFGHRSFFLGEVRSDGWLLFFPVATLLKNPLPLTLLALLGAVMAVPASRRDPSAFWACAAAVAIGAIFLVSMPSRINIGFRHVMPVLPMMAALAAFALNALWERSTRQYLRVFLVVLVIWFGTSSVRAHPDYLAYFNLLAGKEPDRVLPFSDLDWGQDLGRLAEEVQRRGVDTLTLGSAVSVPYELLRSSMDFPPLWKMPPLEPVTGWVAVDAYTRRMGAMHDLTIPINAYNWVERFQPVAKVGHTFLLYYFPPDSMASLARVVEEHRQSSTR